MLIGSHHLALGVGIPQSPGGSFLALGHEISHPLTGDRQQRGGRNRVTKEGNRVPRLGGRLTLYFPSARSREDHTVYRAPQKAIGPIREQIAYVDQNRRGRVGFCSRGTDRDRDPGVFRGQDLESGLAFETEEHGHRAVV